MMQIWKYVSVLLNRFALEICKVNINTNPISMSIISFKINGNEGAEKWNIVISIIWISIRIKHILSPIKIVSMFCGT